jgi:O-acetyl-ADP-ribose deacetylase (regulator of RNase III)
MFNILENIQAFPCIASGAYQYPVKKAAIVALSTVHDFLMKRVNVM